MTLKGQTDNTVINHVHIPIVSPDIDICAFRPGWALNPPCPVAIDPAMGCMVPMPPMVPTGWAGATAPIPPIPVGGARCGKESCSGYEERVNQQKD